MQPTTLQIFPSHAELVLDESTWKGFFLYQKHFLYLLTLIQTEQQDKKRQDIQLRTQRDQGIFNQSIQELQHLINPQPFEMIGSEHDRLYQMCQQVGDYLGLKFVWQKDFISQNLEERLQTLCMHSQIYFRRIRLFGPWWQNQAIPFVAFHQEENPQPVALLPDSSSSYQVSGLSAGKKIPVTQEIAHQLSKIGYTFYRQLPPSQLSLREMGRFMTWKKGKEWLTLLFLGLCSLVASFSFPFINQLLFDVVIPNRNETLLWEIAAGGFLIAFATLAFNYGREALVLRLSNLIDHDLELAVWQKLINLSVRFFRRYSIYDLFTFTSIIPSMRQLLTSQVIQVMLNGCFAILYFFLMFYYSKLLAFIGLGIIVVETLAIFLILHYGVRYGRQALDLQIQANNKMLEMVQALTKVRLAGVEGRMFQRWENSYAQKQQMNLKMLFLGVNSNVFNVFWKNTGLWILYFAVILMITAPIQPGETPVITLSLGSFMAFMSVFGLFSDAIQQVGTTLLGMISIIPLWEKAKLFTDIAGEKLLNQADPGILQGEIRIDQLTFGYAPNKPPILHAISLHIHPGEYIAIIGPSGEGKTTIIRHLLGFETSEQGSIYYDNKDLKGLNLQALRSQLGVVLQSGVIFDGTILDNINSGRHYTVEEVQEALFLSGAAPFVQELPMGIHTVLTNGGMALSGGQRQLILLARAMVGKPKILILDEATSSLDNQTQKIIQDHLSRLPMTRIVVAQRLNTIQQADRIYVIDKGHIVDQGTFTELAQRTGFFSDLLAKQSLT